MKNLSLLFEDCQNSSFGKILFLIILSHILVISMDLKEAEKKSLLNFIMVFFLVARYSATKATAIAIFCSFFSVFDIPVFWPILLIYFCILFAITMRRQIKHMIKYKYIPFDWGKKNYGPGSSRSR